MIRVLIGSKINGGIHQGGGGGGLSTGEFSGH